MKIELEEPYKSKWKTGYILINRENRRTVLLVNDKYDRTSTQYARYLMSVKLGRFLDSELETVDHIDGDKTNDNIDNLQLLTRLENIRKSQKKEDFKCICPVCNIDFLVPRNRSGRIVREKIKNNQICCSRKCGDIFSSLRLNNK